MIEKNFDNTENPTELMDTLRRGYSGDREKAVEDCPVSENAIAYAFEELAPDAQQKVEEHLQFCRACMNLVLDAREEESESQAQDDRPVTVLPELSEAINRPAKPSLIEKLSAAFKMPSMVPKMIATAAVAFLAAPMVYYAFIDQAVDTKLPVVKNKIASAQIEKKKQIHRPSNDSQEEPVSLNTISTREEWATDPFEPLINGKSGRVAAKKKRAKRMPTTPLEALDLSQLKLVGVTLSDKGNTALVEDASGKGYIIKEGTYIGTKAGKVIQILKDRFIIEEKIEDVHGEIITQKMVIKLHKP